MASEDNANKRKLASDDNADKNQISSNDNVGKGQVSSGDNADKRHRDCKYESVVYAYMHIFATIRICIYIYV